MTDHLLNITFLPKNKKISVPSGTNLLEAAQRADIFVPNFCGSRGKCGKCKVKLVQSTLPYTAQEEVALTPEERSQGIHLACQIAVNNDLIVEVIREENLKTTRFLTYDLAEQLEVDHHLKKYYLELPKPELQHLRDDVTNIIDHIQQDARAVMPLVLLQSLSTFLRKNDFKITVTLDGNQIINIEAGDTSQRLFGVAIDLGTTTIVGSLVNMLTGQILAVASRTNPQSIHGADVISRVNFCISEPGGLGKLQTLAIEAINEIIEELCENSGEKFRDIYELSLAGNTIMNHLFLGANPQFIAEAPYTPAYRRSQKFRAEELGIAILPRGSVITLPNISGYVGGDITGFILACKLHQQDKVTLGIDIGTNGEIVLGSKEKLICCSTAAGPAFEGGQISCGMRAMEGAIDKYVIDEAGVFYHVIGNIDPRGVCGTGLVDVVAELLSAGIVDETGRIVAPEQFHGLDWLKKRILPNDKNYDFALVNGEDGARQMIKIKQQDIRELQLAKGAMAAGIEILMKELGISVDQIEQVFIAGAFGSYLNKYNALKIGLLPAISPEKIHFVGNAASLGAKKFLLSQRARDEAEYIINTTHYIELAGRQDFQEIFAEKMFFIQ
ncbi:MAG: ASKHA domain-containing protein [candidate division KSB1 bacterium]|nr:ASKHA domain-containing protein [candidate division KSB1 bacterium]MDZ7335643.1 ASKHA domain-containing protein [candidate division KSB1 bacterium]MDZ7399833.1 ASKHA domain-containing protein [candidate division KSB1 bacterium]